MRRCYAYGGPACMAAIDEAAIDPLMAKATPTIAALRAT
jgi:hypothetical protein